MLTYLPFLFFAIAILHSTVGFGGGTSYIAILSLLGTAFSEVRTIGLLCNLLVVGINILMQFKEKNFKWTPTLLLCLVSLPFSYVGSRIKMSGDSFNMILGTCLIVSGFLMIISNRFKTTIIKAKKHFALAAGSGVGFLAGLTGIGGGIFLSPLMYLTKLAPPKNIATMSSIFIASNSASGILGLANSGNMHYDKKTHLPLLIAVALGSVFGNKTRIKLLTPKRLTTLTSFFIIYAGYKLLTK